MITWSVKSCGSFKCWYLSSLSSDNAYSRQNSLPRKGFYTYQVVHSEYPAGSVSYFVRSNVEECKKTAGNCCKRETRNTGLSERKRKKKFTGADGEIVKKKRLTKTNLEKLFFAWQIRVHVRTQVERYGGNFLKHLDIWFYKDMDLNNIKWVERRKAHITTLQNDDFIEKKIPLICFMSGFILICCSNWIFIDTCAVAENYSA